MGAIELTTGFAPASEMLGTWGSGSLSSVLDRFRTPQTTRQRSRSEHSAASENLTAQKAQSSTYASAFELRQFAEARVASFESSGAYTATDRSRDRFEELVSGLVTDGGPTPQVAVTPSRAIEIQWLCAGNQVSAILDADGYLSIVAEDSDGVVVLDAEVDGNAAIESTTLDEARAFLRTMGEKVRARPLDWN